MTKLMDYRYDECGLDNVILKDFPVCTDDSGETVVTIAGVNRLHKAIMEAVASKPSGLQPKEVRFLRTELGLTQAELAKVVGKDAQTVGRWERGEFPIEQAYEMVIRRLALEHLAVQNMPSTETLAQCTVKSAGEPPLMIDASNPKRYRQMSPERRAA